MDTTLNRRAALRTLAGAMPLVSAVGSLFGAETSARKRLGIGMHSYGAHWRAARTNGPGAKFADALGFLEHAHRLGAGGVQVALGAKDSASAPKLRAVAESYGMYFEGQLILPKDEGDMERFESDVRLAKEAGATVVRTACLSGRRYETFDTTEAFREFRARSWRSLTLAEPVLRKHRVRVAVENHKDWLVPELLEWLRRISSEYVGVTVDIGNSIALLEDAMEVAEAYAPFAASTHIKDMGVQEYEEGFLLSEVPLGEGYLDLKRIINVLAKANPQLQFNLEMITRDPLKVPCLTPKYWATMESARAQQLAEALGRVRRSVSAKPLPRTTGLSAQQQLGFEEENVRKSLAYAREHLGI
jgi:sugar phosphate isomerase/epimerase